MLTEPFPHQRTALQRAAGEQAFALFMEQGTGKSWCTFAFSEQVNAQALVVVAPAGLHRNWIEREAPKHFTQNEGECLLWESGKYSTYKWQRKFDAWRAYAMTGPKPALIAFNVEAFSQPQGPAARCLKEILRTLRCVLAVDESDSIASPSAARTRTLMRLAPLAQWRLILTGTPVDESPFNAYAQFKFLNRAFLGHDNFASFKAHYAEFVQRTLRPSADGTQRSYPDLVRYRNLDELKERIDKHSFSILKKDCLNIPEKLYARRPVELTADTRKLYESARTRIITELRNDGRLTVAHALTRLLRLQQITGGHVADTLGEKLVTLPRNPKLFALKEMCAALPHTSKALIFHRFTEEARASAAALNELNKGIALTHVGEQSEQLRAQSVDMFQNGPGRFLCATIASAGRGLTLTAADHVIYFSCDFSLRNRRQSEDRAHRIGQNKNVLYTDLVASNTIDERILATLEEKRELADLFMGGTAADIANWLEGQ